MAYTPGTLHIARSNIDGTAQLGKATIIPSSDQVKDPSGAVVLSGALVVDLVDENGIGTASVELPPTHGMDPDPVTYTVALQLYGPADPDPITGVEIEAGDVTELADWTSVVPGQSVPNVEKVLQGYATAAAASSAAADASADAAAASAAQVVGDLGAAVNLGNVSGTLDLSAYVLGSQVFRCVAIGNVTIDTAKLPAPPAGLAGSCSLRIQQDATATPRLLTLPAGVLTSFGLDPVLSTASNAIDLLHFLWDGASWECYVGGQALA